MQAYDHARAYLHSRTLAWSWGAIAGRHGNWQAEVAWLSPPEMLRRLALAGFAAVWIDRLGWAKGRPSPYAHSDTSPEDAIVATAGLPAEASADGRYSLVGLSDLRRRLEAALGPDGSGPGLDGRSARPGRPAVAARVQRSGERGAQQLAVGRKDGAPLFRNSLARTRRLELAARISAAGARGARPHERPLRGGADAGQGAVDWRRTVVLPARTRVRIDFVFEGPEPCPEEGRCFQVADFSSSDTADTSLPLDEDGGEGPP